MRRPKNIAGGVKWNYTHIEDGYSQVSTNYDHLQNIVREHRHRNNYPVGTDFARQFDDNICNNAKEGQCEEDVPPSLLSRAVRFTKAMANWGSSGFKLRSQEEVERIMDICQVCPSYTGENTPFRIGCKRCGCSAKKTYVATEHCPINRW